MTMHESGSPQADDRTGAHDHSGCPGGLEIGVNTLGDVGLLPATPGRRIGVAKVFTPGATTGEITGWVSEHFATAG
jgi:hypothetical protein